MSDWPTVAALLITYKRTNVAVKTVQGVKNHLDYPGSIQWVVTDDGSDASHIRAIYDAIGEHVPTVRLDRKGVGATMNAGMKVALAHADYILWLEDDWELQAPFNLAPCVELLRDQDHLGMIRLGYISPGLRGELITGAGRLWWQLARGPQYTFSGHAALRHRRFCETYGNYQEGLAPGDTELYMCGVFNNRPGPSVVIPAWTGIWGPFGHIGAESLKDVRPG